MQSSTIQERCIGLDPISRSTMKLFARDILCLEPVECPSLKTSGLFSYKGHVVNRVEVMGIIVRVDKRDRRHSYAVDDGTGVIQCTCWKNSRHDNLKNIHRAGLPQSLQAKLDDLESAATIKSEEGYDIGDLLLVRGSVKTYQERLEIDVLDHRKIENVCLEYQRVLQLPSLYKLYNQPLKLPQAIEKVVKNTDQNAFNKEAVESAIATEIQARFSSPANDPVFSLESVLSWPAVRDLLLQDGNTGNFAKPQQLDIVRTALLSLETARGWVLRRENLESETVAGVGSACCSFEMVTSTSSLSRRVLSILQDACLKSDHYSEKGCHIMYLMDCVNESFNKAKTKLYGLVGKPTLCRALECLVISSEVIEVSNQRYIPLS